MLDAARQGFNGPLVMTFAATTSGLRRARSLMAAVARTVELDDIAATDLQLVVAETCAALKLSAAVDDPPIRLSLLDQGDRIEIDVRTSGQFDGSLLSERSVAWHLLTALTESLAEYHRTTLAGPHRGFVVAFSKRR